MFVSEFCLALLFAICCIGSAQNQTCDMVIPRVPLRRLWLKHEQFGIAHFSTASESEYKFLQHLEKIWQDEGNSGFLSVLPDGMANTAIHRMYKPNPVALKSFAVFAEKDTKKKTTEGWKYEALLGYCSEAQVNGTNPIYRYTNPENGDYWVVNTDAELNAIKADPKTPYRTEGIICYAYTTE